MRRRVDFEGERALFRQIADILRARITSGRWEPGRNLPSEAALGHEYEVSQATIRRTLAILRAEGLVESVRGRPWRVRDRGEVAVIPAGLGARVSWRLATRQDLDRHGIPEGTPVLVVHDGQDETVYRADSTVVEFNEDQAPT